MVFGLGDVQGKQLNGRRAEEQCIYGRYLLGKQALPQALSLKYRKL